MTAPQQETTLLLLGYQGQNDTLHCDITWVYFDGTKQFPRYVKH